MGKNKKKGIKPQSNFGKFAKRVSRKKDYTLLAELSAKKLAFQFVPCKKELTEVYDDKDKNGEKVQKTRNILEVGKPYSISKSGLDMKNGITYFAISNAPERKGAPIIPGRLFFEQHEVEDYFDLGEIEKLGYTLADTPVMSNEITYDLEKVENFEKAEGEE